MKRNVELEALSTKPKAPKKRKNDSKTNFIPEKNKKKMET